MFLNVNIIILLYSLRDDQNIRNKASCGIKFFQVNLYTIQSVNRDTSACLSRHGNQSTRFALFAKLKIYKRLKLIGKALIRQCDSKPLLDAYSWMILFSMWFTYQQITDDYSRSAVVAIKVELSIRSKKWLCSPNYRKSCITDRNFLEKLSKFTLNYFVAWGSKIKYYG